MSIFSKISMDIDMQGVFNFSNFECQNYNRLIQYNPTHILFIKSELRLSLIGMDNCSNMTHIRNVLPASKTAGMQWFDYRIYHGYTKEKPSSIVESTNVGIRAFCGQYLHKTIDQNRLYYNQVAETITTKNGVDIYTSVKPNILNSLIYYSKASNINWVYYATNTLANFSFVPGFEIIMYPMECTKHAKGLYTHFEEYNNETLIRNDSLYSLISPSSSIELNRPRFLFSFDRGVTYYKFNTVDNTWTLQTPTNGEYFTYTEFISKSNTYSEYIQIKQTDWNNLYQSDWRYEVLSNNYIFPILIGEKFWETRLDSTNWLQYNHSTNAITTFMYGAI